MNGESVAVLRHHYSRETEHSAAELQHPRAVEHLQIVHRVIRQRRFRRPECDVSRVVEAYQILRRPQLLDVHAALELVAADVDLYRERFILVRRPVDLDEIKAGEVLRRAADRKFLFEFITFVAARQNRPRQQLPTIFRVRVFLPRQLYDFVTFTAIT